MPTYCDPWPGKRNASLPRRLAAAKDGRLLAGLRGRLAAESRNRFRARGPTAHALGPRRGLHFQSVSSRRATSAMRQLRSAVKGPPAARSLGADFGPVDQAFERVELLEQPGLLIGRIGENLNVAIPVDRAVFGARLLRGRNENCCRRSRMRSRPRGADGRARDSHGRGLGVQVERRAAFRQPFDRPLNLCGRRQDLVMKGQRRLDQPG